MSELAQNARPQTNITVTMAIPERKVGQGLFMTKGADRWFPPQRLWVTLT